MKESTLNKGMSYCLTIGLTPDIYSLLLVLVNTTNGLPAYLLSEFEDLITEAVEEGFIQINNDRLWFTQKAFRAFDYILSLKQLEEGSCAHE